MFSKKFLFLTATIIFTATVLLLSMALAAAYSGADIGGPTPSGGTTVVTEGTDYNVVGGGADIYGTSDQFHFAYQQRSGDFDVKVRINSLTNAHQWTKAGLMARESLNANSVNVMMEATPATSYCFQYRTSTGGSTAYTTVGTAGYPNTWVRLKRAGNNFSGYYSSDGTNWTQAGATQTIALPSTVYFGMAVTSHNTSSAATAEFRGLANVAAVTPTPTPGTTPTPTSAALYRVNVGGSSFTDGSGKVWSADQAYTSGGWGYVSGSAYSTPDAIANTNDDTLYQSTRFNSTLEYKFDNLSSGNYEVRLHFAELFWTASGGRKFDVTVEGQTKLTSYDIYAEAGHDAAVVKSYILSVTDGQLNILLTATVDNACLNAVEVLSTTAATPTPTPTLTPTPMPSAFPTPTPPPGPGPSGRNEMELSGSGWKIWMDTSAAWSNDSLYLPNEVYLPNMPVNQPSGGWTNMYNNQGTSCSVPACVEEFFGSGVNSWTYHGVSWFWKTVDIPSGWNGKTVLLRLEKARMRAEIYVNETLAGYDLVAETPYATDISSYLNYGASNKIAIRITNPGGNRGWEDYPAITWGSYSFPASHDFGGIGGQVTLVASNNTYIDNVFVKNLLPAGGRNIEVRTTVRNKLAANTPLTLAVDIYPYPSGASVYTNSWNVTANGQASTEIVKPVTVPGATLWDLNHPNLYYCKVTVTGTGISDEASERFGFRSFEVKTVNGKQNYYLNGARIRHRSAIDWGYYALTGFYATDAMAQKSVQAARDIGHNGINFHRRIGEPLVIKYADELGLYLFEEPGAFHAGGQGYTVTDGTFAARIMEEKCRRMAIRDRNHPSLIIYNLCNEDNNWNTLRDRVMYQFRDLDGTRLVTNSSGGNNGGGSGPTRHIRPYETPIRTDYIDDHTVTSDSRFQESDLGSHMTTDDANIKYWGEVRCYTGPGNWYNVAEMKNSWTDGRTGYDLNLYQPLHDQIASYFTNCNLSTIGSRNIQSVADVSRQAGRGLMYIDGRLGQSIMTSDSEDGYAINGWSSGPQLPDAWDSAICDEGRNLKGVAGDFAYWTRELQIAILRQNGKYFDVNGIAQFDVYLINEGKLAAGSYTLKLRVKDGDGNYTSYTNDSPVNVTGGDTFAQKFLDNVSITMNSGWKGGQITVEGKLYNGSTEVANGAEQVLLRNRSSYYSKLSPFTGAVYSWAAAKTAITDTGVSVSDFLTGLGTLKYIAAGSVPDSATLDNMLQRVSNSGTLLIVKFDSNWATTLYNKGILAQNVTSWGGAQSGGWNGNSWGYLDHFTGGQAVPSVGTIGTNSWEVPGDPYGFYPFESSYTKGAYGFSFGRNNYLYVLIGTINYGSGKILLDATYQIDGNNVFNDLLFYNFIYKGCNNQW